MKTGRKLPSAHCSLRAHWGSIPLNLSTHMILSDCVAQALSPILEMEELRLRENLVQGHTSEEWKRWDSQVTTDMPLSPGSFPAGRAGTMGRVTGPPALG